MLSQLKYSFLIHSFISSFLHPSFLFCYFSFTLHSHFSFLFHSCSLIFINFLFTLHSCIFHLHSVFFTFHPSIHSFTHPAGLPGRSVTPPPPPPPVQVGAAERRPPRVGLPLQRRRAQNRRSGRVCLVCDPRLGGAPPGQAGEDPRGQSGGGAAGPAAAAGSQLRQTPAGQPGVTETAAAAVPAEPRAALGTQGQSQDQVGYGETWGRVTKGLCSGYGRWVCYVTRVLYVYRLFCLMLDCSK